MSDMFFYLVFMNHTNDIDKYDDQIAQILEEAQKFLK